MFGRPVWKMAFCGCMHRSSGLLHGSQRTLGNDLGLEGLGIGTAFLWHGRPLKKAKNGVHFNLGGHHRPKRWDQKGVLARRLWPDSMSNRSTSYVEA